MHQLEALLFDVDGTLADTERGHLMAFNAAFSDAGLDWSWSIDLYKELLSVTGGQERIRHYLEQYRPDFPRPKDLGAFISALHGAKTRHYLAMLDSGGIELRPGVERLLREAYETGLVLAITTTTTPANVTGLIRNTLGPEVLDWFEVIGAGDAVPNKKPAPDIYLYVLEKLARPAHACLALEDSGPGVRSAREAGIPVLATVNDFTRDHDVSGATVVVDSFGEPLSPCHTLSGEPPPRGWVDVEALRAVHARGCREIEPSLG